MVNAQKKCPEGNCPKGKVCVNGYCVKYDLCFCPSGYICIDGYCRRNMPFLTAGSPANEAVNISPANSNAISFQLMQAQNVSAKIYDATGRLVRTLADSRMPEGRHEIEWSTETKDGIAVPAGVYFLRMVTGNYVESKKMLVVK